MVYLPKQYSGRAISVRGKLLVLFIGIRNVMTITVRRTAETKGWASDKTEFPSFALTLLRPRGVSDNLFWGLWDVEGVG
jgi:hypothetical protein